MKIIELTNEEGKMVSFPVKNCGIEMPIIVPILPSITVEEVESNDV